MSTFFLVTIEISAIEIGVVSSELNQAHEITPIERCANIRGVFNIGFYFQNRKCANSNGCFQT